MIENFPYFMVLCFLLTCASVLFAWCKCKSLYFTIPPISIAIITFTILYYISMSQKIITDRPIYLNPLSFVVFSAVIPLGLFVGSFAVKQSRFISQGLNSKQYECISREVMMDKEKRISSAYKLNYNLKFSEKANNIYKFLVRKADRSLI